MNFVGFPMYQPPSFLSPFPKITKKKFISGITFSLTLLPSDWFGSLKPLQVFVLMCSVDRHWFPSFWPWARYSSICWDFQLAISQQFVLRDAELWPALLWLVAFLPCAISSPICRWFFWKILFCVLIVCHQHCACSVLTSHQPPVLVSVL